VVRKVIQQRGYSSVQSADQLRKAWAEIVGDHLAKHSMIGKVERGQLTVVAANKVVATELDYMKSQILRGFQERLPEFSIRSIRVRSDANR
jgi:predicted nucleic acid-binding Zn ribbon protein